MKLWVDDVRPAPEGYYWCKSTNEALRLIFDPHIQYCYKIDIIDLDHDMGDTFGGDAIVILQEFERLSHRDPDVAEMVKNIKFRLHSMNPVGVENMRRIIQRNGWKEV